MLIIKALAGLAFVLLLLYLILKIVQKYGKMGMYKINNSDKINITGVSYIDDSTKVICAVHGPSKYVFVVGRNTSLLLDKYENHEKQ